MLKCASVTGIGIENQKTLDRKSKDYGQKIKRLWIENQKTMDRNSEVKRYKITWIGQKITGIWIENYSDIKNSLGELIDV